jgi:hypothetical protein
MRDAGLAAGAMLMALSVVAAAIFVVAATPHPAPVFLSEDVTFPDYSTGQPGMNGSNEVFFRVTIATALPWEQGEMQNPVVSVAALVGSGVADVNVTTFFLDLGRAGIRGFLTGDLDLMREVSENHWVPITGPMRVWPNSDVIGSDLYLTFQLSLMVQYLNGSGYGYGGWNPQSRLPVAIVTNPVPWGFLITFAGMLPSSVVLVVAWFRRTEATRAARAPRR